MQQKRKESMMKFLLLAFLWGICVKNKVIDGITLTKIPRYSDLNRAGWHRGIYGYNAYPLPTKIQKKVKY